MVKPATIFLLFFLISGALAAQDTLPKFTVTTKGNNRVLVSWSNNYRFVSQISIQRSTDSLRNFKTILTVPDPSVPQNGFVDTKAATPFMFYRLFIILDSSKYEFSKSKRPFWDTAKNNASAAPEKKVTPLSKKVVIADSVIVNDAMAQRNKINETIPPAKDTVSRKPEPEKFFTVKRRDTILFRLSEKNFKSFRDSVIYKTKDTMVLRSADTIVLKTFVPKEVFKPSIFVYTEKEGNLSISLPQVITKNYSIKFFDQKDVPLFEITRVKESPLILDKSNFLRSGWYRFELYEDGKLKEKNKFFIPKDF